MTEKISQALEHTNRAPGKRLRSQLLQAAASSIGGAGAFSRSSRAGEAIEHIHTYSLIHDDLPAMDDDDMRRGQPTLHVAFDEATAILVGDGLQARAFELIASDSDLSAQQRVDLIACLSFAAGFEGMVGGQSMDIEATNQTLTLEQLKQLHALKTGALFVAALEMGAIIGEASDEQRGVLREVGQKIGLAFQIIDDVIDVRSDSETLGKTSGKDVLAGKSTYVSLMGIEAAEETAFSLYDEAVQLIVDWGAETDDLRELLAKMVRRDR